MKATGFSANLKDIRCGKRGAEASWSIGSTSLRRSEAIGHVQNVLHLNLTSTAATSSTGKEKTKVKLRNVSPIG